MISRIERYYGAVLARLVCGTASEVSIQRFGTKSTFVLNRSVGLFIKFSEKRMSPWGFTFLRAHQEEFAKMNSIFGSAFLVLVCETDGIVALDYAETKQLLDENHADVEWIRVSRRKRQQYTVKGSDGHLEFKIADSEFPKKLYERIGVSPINDSELSAEEEASNEEAN